jgi:transmembrane protein 222
MKKVNYEEYNYNEANDISDDKNVGDETVEENQISEIDPLNDRFPYCIVWTTLPCISWFLPMIGHTGIGSSKGIIYDFAGPYTVNENDLAFGKTIKFVKLDPSKVKADKNWDRSIALANEEYSKRIHNLFCDNCHSHVARALNEMEYDGKTNWTMFSVFFLTILSSKYISASGILKTYFPFLILLMIYLFFK